MYLVVFFIMDEHSSHTYFDSIVYFGNIETLEDFTKLKKFIKHKFKDKLSNEYNRIMIRSITKI